MRFPKFALWLCASLLLVALTATADDVNAPETAAGPTPVETADAPAETADAPAETADAPPDAPAEMADMPADAPAETVDAPAEALDETEDAPADALAEMADAPAETADAPTDTLAEIAEAPADIPALEPLAEKADEPVGEPIVEEPIVAAKSPQTAGLVPDDISEDGEDTESEDEAAAAAAEDEVPDEVSEEGDVEAGPIETATELSPDDMKKETEEDDEAAETAAAAVEEKEAESEVTEETEPEVIEPIAVGTDTPPEGDTDETTESAPKVEVINAAVATESSEVVEEEPTSVAPIASSDVESSPSEAPEAAVSSESEEVTAAEATTPAPVPEVAMETGSGAVARENVTTGTSALTSTESNATVETTKTLPEKLVEDDKDVDGEVDEEEVAVYEVEFYDLFDEQQKNIVTLELNSGSTDLNEAYYLAVTQAIADKLSVLLFNGTDSGVLTYVAPSPQGGDGWMQLCIVMKVGIEGAVPQDDLLEGIQTLNLTSFGLTVLKIYAGMPTYGLKVMEYKDLSKAQQSGVVTLELDYAGALLNDAFFKNVIITVAEHYPADVPAEGSLVFVAPTPVVTTGLLQVILVSEIGEEGAVPVKDFMQTLKKLNLSEAGLIVISVKPGMPPTGIQVVELRELSMDQLEGIVTVELDRGANRVLQNEYSIAVAVREMRAMLEDEGLSGNIVFVAPTPVEDDDKIQAAFIVRPAKDQAVHQDKLLQAVRKIDLTKIGVTLANSYTGMPTYGLPIIGYTDLTEAKRDGIVTVVMDTGDKPLNTKFFTHVYTTASERILGNLVNVTNGSLSYVEPTPVIDGGRVHLSMLLVATPTGDSEEGRVVPSKDLLEAVKKLNFSQCEVYLLKIYAGLPANKMVVKLTKLSEAQQNNIVTMVLDSETELRVSDLHVLSRLLAAEGAKGDIVIVSPTPVDEGDNKLRFSIVLKDGEDGAVDQDILLNAVKKADFEMLDTFLYEAYPGMTRPTTMPPPVFPQIQLQDITGLQKENVVTLEFEVRDGTVNDESLKAAHEAFIALLVAELNRMAREKHRVPDVDPEASRRRREVMDEDEFKSGDVSYVSPTPRVIDGKLQFVTVVEDREGNVASQADVLAAIENLNKTGKLPPNLSLVTLYGGMPVDMEATVAPPAARTAPSGVGMWDTHMGLFLAIIILATICFIILIIGFMCIKYRSRRGSWSRKDDEVPMDSEPCGRKYPLVIENPIPDSEIMKGEAPMMESANPAMAYPVSKKDEDNGWVVPLDQLSPAERQKPDTENTKL